MLKRIIRINPPMDAPTAIVEIYTRTPDALRTFGDPELKWSIVIFGTFFVTKLQK